MDQHLANKFSEKTTENVLDFKYWFTILYT